MEKMLSAYQRFKVEMIAGLAAIAADKFSSSIPREVTEGLPYFIVLIRDLYRDKNLQSSTSSGHEGFLLRICRNDIGTTFVMPSRSKTGSPLKDCL